MRNRYLLILILIGFLLRILLAILPGFKIDINDWFFWAEKLSHFNFSQFYSKDYFSDYLPGYLYILSFLGFLRNISQISDSSFYLLLKIPAIISELLICILAFNYLSKQSSKKIALLGTCFIMFNPALIFNSAIWGQIDSVLTLFLLCSIIFFIQRRTVFSSVFFSVGFLIKPQAISIALMFVIDLIKNFTLKKLIKLLLPGSFIATVLTWPFFPSNPLYNLLVKILHGGSEYPFTSLNAYNLWGIVGFWIPNNISFNGLSYQVWGYILLGIYWIIIGYLNYKKKFTTLSLVTYSTLSFFFLPTMVHERYLYPALVLLTITAFQVKSKILVILTSLLSILHLANLYYVYIYYNKFYFHFSSLLYLETVYNFLVSQSKLLSIISTIIFIAISSIAIKLTYENKDTN